MARRWSAVCSVSAARAAFGGLAALPEVEELLLQLVAAPAQRLDLTGEGQNGGRITGLAGTAILELCLQLLQFVLQTAGLPAAAVRVGARGGQVIDVLGIQFSQVVLTPLTLGKIMSRGDQLPVEVGGVAHAGQGKLLVQRVPSNEKGCRGTLSPPGRWWAILDSNQ